MHKEDCGIPSINPSTHYSEAKMDALKLLPLPAVCCSQLHEINTALQ